MVGAEGSTLDELRAEGRGRDEMPEEFKHLPEREREQGMLLRQMFADQEHGLRQSYADWIIRLLGVQLLVADAVFVVFAWAGWDWQLKSGVIEVWLAATVVQVVSVMAIVTRHLFPRRARGEVKVLRRRI